MFYLLFELHCFQILQISLKDPVSLKSICRIWKFLTLAFLSGVKTEAAADSDAQDVFDYWETVHTVVTVYWLLAHPQWQANQFSFFES